MQHEPMENWEPIGGYEGVYSVSNMGRVRRDIRAPRGRMPSVLSPAMSTNGYLGVRLKAKGIGELTTTVHRLVAIAFLGDRPDGLVLNHKNGVRTDNRASNLEYVTQAENLLHSRDVLGNRRDGERNPQAKCTREQVDWMRRIYRHGKLTQKTLSEAFGVSKQAMNLILLGKTWASMGAAA